MPVSDQGALGEIRSWCSVAARAAAAKQGLETVILDVGAVLGITDAFVITSGTNSRQVRTIAEEVEKQLKASGISPLRAEGLDDARWILLDYAAFVVHVFLAEAREFYDLERLWRDVPRWEWQEAGAVVGGRG